MGTDFESGKVDEPAPRNRVCHDVLKDKAYVRGDERLPGDERPSYPVPAEILRTVNPVLRYSERRKLLAHTCTAEENTLC
jgi:hypothetical protein